MTPGIVERDGETRIRVMKGMELTRRQAILAAAGVVFLFILPDLTKVSNSIQLSVIHQGLLFGFAAVGLNLLLRHTQLTSFGHAAFFGTGAYAAAVMAQYLGVESIVLLVVGAVLAATVVAGIIGVFSLRHTGLYFALLTLAFGQLLYAIALGQKVLGGSDGLAVRPGAAKQPLILGAALNADAYRIVTYYMTVVLIIVGLLMMWRIVQSPFTNALDAVGQDRTRARFIGLPVRKYVWTAFVISGMYGGLAGGLYAVVRQYVRPEGTLFFLRSGDILFMAILGGFKTLLGPLLGGVVLIFVQDVGQDVTAYYEALTGLILIVLVFGFPKGIVGSLGASGSLKLTARRLREDPSLAGSWLRDAAGLTVAKLQDVKTNLKIIIMGVR